MKKYSQGKDYKVIAYCISRFHREEQKEDIFLMCRYAREYHCKVMVFSTLTDLYYDDMNDYGEKQIYSMLQPEAFDAVVIMSETFKKTNIVREIADRTIKAGVPVISVNRQLEGCTNIDFTYSETFEAIVRHIVEYHGCRKVNYIGGDHISKFSRERLEAYKKVLEDNGIPFEERRTGLGYFRKQQALEVLEGFLEEKELPDAIICANDVMAVAVCARLRALGLRVPEDIKVTGFDGDEVEKYHNPRLTTAAYDWDRTIRTIFEMALDLSDGKKVDQTVWVPYIRQLGHSCGCNYNYVYSASEKLFDAQIYHGDNEDFYQDVMNVSSKAIKCEDFSELLALTNQLSRSINYKEYWLCFLEESYRKIINRLPSEVEFEKTQGGKDKENMSKAQVVVASHVNNEVKSEPDKSESGEYQINSIELIPELESVLEKEDFMMFIPIQLQGLFIGYLGMTFHTEQVRFGFLNLYTMNLRNMIESYWSRVAQEQLMVKDELTGLYNNKGYEKKIKRLFAKGNAADIVLFLLDMDNLKAINDCYGHEEGDQILKQIGHFIEEIANEGELCARVEGDEFMIVSTSNAGRARAQEIQNALERKIAEYNLSSGKPYDLEASVGYAVARDADLLDYKSLCSQADRELYENRKNHGVITR